MAINVPVDWVEVRSPRGHLICRIDRERGLLEWRRADEKVIVDLVAVLRKIDVTGEHPTSEST